MKIRRTFEKYEKKSITVKQYREIFLGTICGIILSQRGDNDPHVVFNIICEDDGFWFNYTNNGASSYWLKEYEDVIKAARKWCEKNCIPDIHDGVQYGWKFIDTM